MIFMSQNWLSLSLNVNQGSTLGSAAAGPAGKTNQPEMTRTNLRVPLKRSDGLAQWQNPCDTKRFLSLLVIRAIYRHRKVQTASAEHSMQMSVDLPAQNCDEPPTWSDQTQN